MPTLTIIVSESSGLNKVRVCVRTSVCPGVQHVVQHGPVVHVKAVSDVSQSVRTTCTKVLVKDQVKQRENIRMHTLYSHMRTTTG